MEYKSRWKSVRKILNYLSNYNM